jgi:hypothetical protein
MAEFARVTDEGRPAEEPTVTGALDRAVDAVEGLVTDEINLARVNLEATIVGTFAGSALVAVGGILGLGAWTVLMIAAYELLLMHTSQPASLAVIAGINVILAIAFMAAGAARLRQPSETPAAVDNR